jgi:hypothetical protein
MSIVPGNRTVPPSYNKAIGWKTALSVLAVVALLGLWAAIVRRN